MEHTPEELTRVREYISAFKRIEAHLRTELEASNADRTFKSLSSEYVERVRGLGKHVRKTLDDIADLRNVLQHHEADGQYFSIPSAAALRMIKVMETRLMQPTTLYSYMQRHLKDNLDVRTLAPSTPLGEALRLVREERFTYFPVIGSGDTFRGLLTSNGLAIWLADHAANLAEDGLVLLELESVTVEDLLPKEEARTSWTFISREALLREVVALYEENAHLETVLMTHSGRPAKPMAIVTTFDLPQMREHL